MYISNERKLVEALYLGDLKSISDNLQKLLREDRENAAVIILREALVGGYLGTCSREAAVISGIILDAKPQRIMLARLGEQINNPTNRSLGNEWVDTILAVDTGLSVDQWIEVWDRNEDVQAVKRLFGQAPYSNAINERCRPIKFPQPDNCPENTGGRVIPELVFD